MGMASETHNNTEPRVQRLVVSHVSKGAWDRKVQLARGFVFLKGPRSQ